MAPQRAALHVETLQAHVGAAVGVVEPHGIEAAVGAGRELALDLFAGAVADDLVVVGRL